MEQNINRLYGVVVGVLISALLIFGGGKFYGSTIANLKEKAFDKQIVTKPSLRNLNGGDVSAWNTTPEQIKADVKSMNLNSVSVPFVIDIPNLQSSQANLRDMTHSLEIVKELKAEGKRVIVEPYPLIASSDEGGDETSLNPTDKDLFMKNWSDAVLTVAKAVKGYAPEGLYIGSNFVKLEQTESKSFDKLIEDLRPEFKGNILYRTNFWYTADWAPETISNFNDKKQIEFFKNVDVLSIAAYFEVSDPDEMDVTKLREKMKNVTVYNRGQNIIKELEELHQATGKPIIFGELGITNHTTAMKQPYAYWLDSSLPTDENIQSVWYEAWIKEMRQYSWFYGYTIFSIGEKESVFYPNAKAQETLRALNK